MQKHNSRHGHRQHRQSMQLSYDFLLVVCSSHASVLHRFRNITIYLGTISRDNCTVIPDTHRRRDSTRQLPVASRRRRRRVLKALHRQSFRLNSANNNNNNTEQHAVSLQQLSFL